MSTGDDAWGVTQPRAAEWDLAEKVAASFMRDHLDLVDAVATAETGDYGIDVIATATVGQVKWHVGAVGRPDIQRLVGAGADHPGCSLVFFSRSNYSQGAVEYADRHRIALFTYTGGPEALFAAVNSEAEARIAATERARAEHSAEQRRQEQQRAARVAHDAAEAAEAWQREHLAREQAEALRLANERTRSEAEAARRFQREQAKREALERRRAKAEHRGHVHRQRQEVSHQQRQERRAALPNGYSAKVGASAVVAAFGCLLPVGAPSLLAWWLARTARADLSRSGIARSTPLLRVTAVMAGAGLVLFVLVVFSLVAQLTGQMDADGDTTLVGDVLMGLLLLGAIPLTVWFLVRNWRAARLPPSDDPGSSSTT